MAPKSQGKWGGGLRECTWPPGSCQPFGVASPPSCMRWGIPHLSGFLSAWSSPSSPFSYQWPWFSPGVGISLLALWPFCRGLGEMGNGARVFCSGLRYILPEMIWSQSEALAWIFSKHSLEAAWDTQLPPICLTGLWANPLALFTLPDQGSISKPPWTNRGQKASLWGWALPQV